jgi:Protein of unknown function (DUF3995)
MVLFSIGLLLFFVFLFLSLIHIYWGVGGKWGASASIPTKEDGEKVMNPKPFDCFVIAIGLSAFGVLMLVKAQLVSLVLPSVIFDYGVRLVIFVFLLRAIGEFRYVGFFKKIKNTPFGQLDTKYYSPLCLLIAIMGILLESLS